MLSAFGRFWTVLKARLAIGLLAGMSLFWTNLVDQKDPNPLPRPWTDPTTTGSLKVSRAH